MTGETAAMRRVQAPIRGGDESAIGHLNRERADSPDGVGELAARVHGAEPS
jgi:hypothetical protein